jgi:hypothetical protein
MVQRPQEEMCNLSSTSVTQPIECFVTLSSTVLQSSIMGLAHEIQANLSTSPLIYNSLVSCVTRIVHSMSAVLDTENVLLDVAMDIWLERPA